jgi:hypothetical protein
MESEAWIQFKSSRDDLSCIAATRRGKAADLVSGLVVLTPSQGPTYVVMGDCVFDDKEFARFFKRDRNDVDLVVGVRPRGDQPRQSFAIGSVSLAHGYRKHHRSYMPVLLFTIGILLLFAKQLWHDYQFW